MKEVCSHLSKYFIPKSHEVRKICAYLLRHYQIDSFLYFRIDAQGQYSLLTNVPLLCESWHDNEFYRTNCFCSSPTFFTPMRLITRECNPKEQEYMKQRHNIQDEIIVIQKPSSDKLESFAFGSTQKKNKVHTLALSYPHIYDAFIEYFKKEAKHLISHVNENPISILPFRGNAFYTPPQTIENLNALSQTNQKLIQAFSSKPSSDLDILTPAERRCVEFYRKHYTALETAQAINCSKRTVEAHFANILRKLNLKNKRKILRLETDSLPI